MNINEAYLEILESEKLDEGIIKKSLVGAAIVGSALLATHKFNSTPEAPIQAKEIVGKVTMEKKAPSREKMLNTVLAKYKIGKEKAEHIVDTAIKHARPDFPKAHDILAVVGVESSFNEKAKSALKKDPAIGLMQVRKKVWNLGKHELNDIEGQIKHGSSILQQYHKKLGNPDSALHAYNVGLTNFLKQKNLNPKYVTKVNTEKSLYED